jgi:hypothetical protein
MPTRRNRLFLLATSIALLAWIVFLAVMALGE